MGFYHDELIRGRGGWNFPGDPFMAPACTDSPLFSQLG